MKHKQIVSALLIVATALSASSCGTSKRSLKKTNAALTQMLQTSIQTSALQTVNETSRGNSGRAVSRENPGQTTQERTIIRWFIDSAPKGAQVYYRVISSIPEQVKNTNETYLMTTPYEETRPFNIIGLTYDNANDVQIEIKVSRNGYYDQVKRFNVRQALDQQEISSFFNLVKIEDE